LDSCSSSYLGGWVSVRVLAVSVGSTRIGEDDKAGDLKKMKRMYAVVAVVAVAVVAVGVVVAVG